MDAVLKVSFMEYQNILILVASGMLNIVDWYIFTDISKERSAKQPCLIKKLKA
jgi:hypothetical protein